MAESADRRRDRRFKRKRQESPQGGRLKCCACQQCMHRGKGAARIEQLQGLETLLKSARCATTSFTRCSSGGMHRKRKLSLPTGSVWQSSLLSSYKGVEREGGKHLPGCSWLWLGGTKVLRPLLICYMPSAYALQAGMPAILRTSMPLSPWTTDSSSFATLCGCVRRRR